MTLKHDLRKLLWKAGYDISRFAPQSHPLARRRRLMRALEIGVVLDVGANAGEFAERLREEVGFKGYIRSFEPMASAFAELERRASRDPEWEAYNMALGDVKGTSVIHIAANSYSSSILEMLPAHLDAAPEARFIGEEEIRVETLDNVFDSVCPRGANAYLKIDTQGFEARVVRGAEASLRRIKAVQMELSLTPLYQGESSFIDLYRAMEDRGFVLVAVDPGFNDPRDGRLLQVDGIFVRNS